MRFSQRARGCEPLQCNCVESLALQYFFFRACNTEAVGISVRSRGSARIVFNRQTGKLIWRSLTPPSKIGKGSGEQRTIDLCRWNAAVNNRLPIASSDGTFV